MTRPLHHNWLNHDSSGRSRTCQQCGMRTDRFGVGKTSYYIWSLPGGPGGDTQGGETIPGCLGPPNPHTAVPHMPRVNYGTCDAHTRKGTGSGMCDRLLDKHGQCDRASDHID